MFDTIKEMRYYTRSDKIFGCITAAVTLALYFVSYFIIPLFFPHVHFDAFITYFFGGLFIPGFLLSLYVTVIRIFGYGYDISFDCFMAGWFYALMGFILFVFYFLVIALKAAYIGNPKVEFFFDGKTNLYSLLNGGMVVGMIAAFIFIPVFAIRYIDDNDYNSKFYSFVAGVMFAVCVANLPEIVSAAIKWLNS